MLTKLQKTFEITPLRRACVSSYQYSIVTIVTIQGHLCGANLWFGGFPYPVNPGRPEWSKVQTLGKPLVATAQAKYMSAGER